jgi:hypothetical protein
MKPDRFRLNPEWINVARMNSLFRFPNHLSDFQIEVFRMKHQFSPTLRTIQREHPQRR